MRKEERKAAATAKLKLLKLVCKKEEKSQNNFSSKVTDGRCRAVLTEEIIYLFFRPFSLILNLLLTEMKDYLVSSKAVHKWRHALKTVCSRDLDNPKNSFSAGNLKFQRYRIFEWYFIILNKAFKEVYNIF